MQWLFSYVKLNIAYFHILNVFAEEIWYYKWKFFFLWIKVWKGELSYSDVSGIILWILLWLLCFVYKIAEVIHMQETHCYSML
jgi:hypothetical protein